MNHQINIDGAIAIAKEYHLEAEVTECIKQGMSPIEALKDTAILSFTLLLFNHTLQSVKIVVF